jgi:MFS superfamily sulfate permease-like transporter
VSVLGGTKPDITATQLAAPLASLVAVLAVVNQEPDRLQIPLIAVIGVIAVVWILADAILRHGRNGAAAAESNLAAVTVANLPAEGDDSLVVAVPPAVPAA